LFKTCQGKPSRIKKPCDKRKRVQYSCMLGTASLKPCKGKLSGKNLSGGKRVQSTQSFYSPLLAWSTSIFYDERSLSRRIPMLFTNFLNVAVGNVLVNKSGKLSLECIYFTSIYHHSSGAHVYKRISVKCVLFYHL
jgi:hypothetical protein